MADDMKLSVVVPVYRGEGTVRELYERTRDAVLSTGLAFELVLVEDCGPDRSWEIIQQLAAEDPRVKGIRFSRNFGQHYGITAGLDYASGDWVVVMDCDLQDRPEEIPRLYAKACEGYDVVLARRTRRQDALIKRITSRIFYGVFSYLADVQYDATVGNFRIISRRVADGFRQMREQLRFFSAQVDWLGFPAASIDVEHSARQEGKSTYTFRRLWHLAADTIISFSDKPLRISVRLGFSLSLISMLYGLWIIWRAIHGGVPVAGWSSLIVSLYFIGGIIIANLGIIGIYIGKSFDEARKRPLYIVRETTFHAEE